MHCKNLAAVAATTLALMFQPATVFAQSKQVVRTQEYPSNLLHLVDWVMRSKGFCAPMATPNCSTFGRSNCSRQDGRMVTIRA